MSEWIIQKKRNIAHLFSYHHTTNLNNIILKQNTLLLSSHTHMERVSFQLRRQSHHHLSGRTPPGGRQDQVLSPRRQLERIRGAVPSRRMRSPPALASRAHPHKVRLLRGQDGVRLRFGVQAERGEEESVQGRPDLERPRTLLPADHMSGSTGSAERAVGDTQSGNVLDIHTFALTF